MYDSIGVEKIKDERERQKIEHGYYLAHDEQHDERELIRTAFLVLGVHLTTWIPFTERMNSVFRAQPKWIQSVVDECSGINNYEHALEVAGALIAAELDRLAYVDNKSDKDS